MHIFLAEGEINNAEKRRGIIMNVLFYVVLALGIISVAFLIIIGVRDLFGPGSGLLVTGTSVVIIGGFTVLSLWVMNQTKAPKPIPTTKMISALDSAYTQLQSTYNQRGSFETVGKTITANGVVFSVSKGVGINSTQKPQSIELIVNNNLGDCIYALYTTPKSMLSGQTGSNGIGGSGRYITTTSAFNGCQAQVPLEEAWHPFIGFLASPA